MPMTETIDQTAALPAMISPEAACELVCSQVAPLAAETVGLLDALGRVAAEPLKSDLDIAPFDHSAMDGYALRSVDLAGASEELPVELAVVGEEAAGEVYAETIEPGTCLRIMTGAPIPAGADTVVKYEIVTTVEGSGLTDGRVRFSAPSEPGANIRSAGEEARAGEVIVEPGEVIGTAGIGFLASCGVTEVKTYRRPRVAIVSIGSELVEPTEVPAAGQIRNSNAYALAACALRCGALPEILPIVPDSLEALCDCLTQATARFDFVVTSGGASNGDFDFIKPAVAELGTLLMTSVNMRPGKAQTFGIVNDCPVFGLPGNPAAAYCGFELIIRPALRRMQGYKALEVPRVRARLSRAVKNKDPRRIYLRATLTRGDDGQLEVTPAKNQSSGLFGTIQRANVLAIVPEGTDPYQAGDWLECLVLDAAEELAL